MPERRVRQVVSAVEPTFHTLILQVASKNNMSTSEYVRSLILRDLDAHGLVTEALLRRVTGT